MYIYIYICIGFRIETAEIRSHCRRPQVPSQIGTPLAAIVLQGPGRSPAWHRRRRAARSGARRRIHKAREEGRHPRPRDISYLERHHSRPQYREARRPPGHYMGKRGGQQWDGQAWDDYRSYAGWQDKAWEPRSAKGKGKNKEPPRKKEENAFPAYEDMKIPSHTAAAGQELLPAGLPQPGRGNGGLARHVQRAVNNLRRSETRLRKLGEEEDAAKAKWEQFQQQLKASFITEPGRYYENLAGPCRPLRLPDREPGLRRRGHRSRPTPSRRKLRPRDSLWARSWRRDGRLPWSPL